jgi:hypothetical protein
MSATTPPPANPTTLATLAVSPAQGAPADAPPTKAETDWKAEARKWEERAKENRSAAERLAAIEESQKTEAQKAADRIAALEAEANDAKALALRFKIAAKFAVSDDDADLFLTGKDEATLTKQAQRLAARTEEAGKARAPKPDPAQGKTGATAGHTTADLFASAVEEQLK